MLRVYLHKVYIRVLCALYPFPLLQQPLEQQPVSGFEQLKYSTKVPKRFSSSIHFSCPLPVLAEKGSQWITVNYKRVLPSAFNPANTLPLLWVFETNLHF